MNQFIIFSFFILFLNKSFSFSESSILLVPDSRVEFQKYQQACSKVGYLCTMNFQIELIKNSESKKWNDFLNQLDYSSEEFKKKLISLILEILKSEQLSFEQIEMLLKIISQSKEFISSKEVKQLFFIENQLNELVSFVRANENQDAAAEVLVVFQTVLPIKYLKKIKSSLLKINWVQVEFNKSYISKNSLVTGTCEQFKTDEIIENTKFSILQSSRCGFSAEFTNLTKSTSEFISEHKNTLITSGLILVGAALFLNKYEVKFNF